jgi:hypothetical protein
MFGCFSTSTCCQGANGESCAVDEGFPACSF